MDLGGVGYLLVFLVCRDFGSLRKVHLGPPVPLVAGASPIARAQCVQAWGHLHTPEDTSGVAARRSNRGVWQSAGNVRSGVATRALDFAESLSIVLPPGDHLSDGVVVPAAT